MKRAEARRLAMLEEAKRERERQREEAARREKEEKAREQEAASKQEAEKANPTTPADGYAGGFGRINTQPIKDQIQKLYEAQKAGLLDLQNDRIKVGVSGPDNR
jgi:hypothetical protein